LLEDLGSPVAHLLRLPYNSFLTLPNMNILAPHELCCYPPQDPLMKVEIDPNTDFPYLLPLQWHMD
jgi:hypothetical protein